jgi:tetratricopeptide (TPR) repeat protein
VGEHRCRPTACGVGLLVMLALVAGACAPRGLPPLPDAPRYSDFVYPSVPQGFDDEALLRRHESGWRYLQFDNLRNAEREFQAALRARPAFFPAEAGLGWVELARRDPDDALVRFDRALAANEGYSPALVGRGQALLALEREDEALDAFERALAVDPSLSDVGRRVELLRFRTVQARIAEARVAAEARRWNDARAAYRAAIAAAPDTAFLYRGLAEVEREDGSPSEALVHARRAVALDPADPSGHVLVAQLLETAGDYEGAVAAYAEARALDPSPEIERAWAAARDRSEFARMPDAYRSIPEAPRVTRGELAAVVGVRLAGLIAGAPARQVVITDVRDHWAQAWIMAVARTGLVEAFPNYTFQPGAEVRRGDLAAAVSRVLGLVASRFPDRAARWQGARPAVTDVPAGHLSYPAVALAVAAGVLALDAEGRFRPLDPVSGAELFDAVRRLEALAVP